MPPFTLMICHAFDTLLLAAMIAGSTAAMPLLTLIYYDIFCHFSHDTYYADTLTLHIHIIAMMLPHTAFFSQQLTKMSLRSFIHTPPP